MQEIRGKDIAMIFQDPMTSLDPTMKIGRQIAEPLMIHKNIDKKKAWAQALEILKLVGIANADNVSTIILTNSQAASVSVS